MALGHKVNDRRVHVRVSEMSSLFFWQYERTYGFVLPHGKQGGLAARRSDPGEGWAEWGWAGDVKDFFFS